MHEFPQGLPFLQTGPLVFFALLLLELELPLRPNAGALKVNETAIAVPRIARIESPSVARDCSTLREEAQQHGGDSLGTERRLSCQG